MHILKGRRGPTSAVTEEMLPRIQELHADGHCATRIADAIGVSVKALYPILTRMGLPPTRNGRRSGVTPGQIEEMIAAYALGENTQSLGRRYGVHDATVARYLRAAGVEIRPAGFQMGEAHHAWTGGRVPTEAGYVNVLVYPDDPHYGMAQVKSHNANGGRYVLEHRLVMARHLGRLLTENETVHHVDDRDRQNNDISNLQLRQGNHGKGAAFQCADCGPCNVVARSLM